MYDRASRAETKSRIDLEGTRNIIQNAIPKKTTNGEVIQMMFPHIEVKKGDVFVEVRYMDSESADDVFVFYTDWWNAPYRRAGE